MKNNLKEQARKLPLSPGVYLMKDKHGTIIYVGKAKKLRERVSSYFVKNKQHSSKNIRMIQQLTDFDVIQVASELDAFLLECQLIQEYRPIYNRQMNSFEKYKYIEINTEKEELSINICTVPTKKNCFGPFSINRRLSELKRILENLYGLNQKNYWQQSFSESTMPPLDRETAVAELLGAFTLNNQLPQNRLETKMILASENQSFEKAAMLREDWQFLTRFFNQNKKLILASQTNWQLLSLPIGSKMKYYLIYQGLVINSRILTKRTFTKYTPSELAKKILPKNKPENRQQFSKDQVDFINILYSYINRHKECQLVELTDLFA
ncbi:excinuclease ABC subunit C [Enterococcus sp. DIV0840]|uniref:GIY-YIG nuclease family protein n=1 Tax=Enterococcus TaxID=1350 RepID=UPI001A8F9E17|nr:MULTISPECIES: GIY-YIG nuclease family protein [Enterococcus]MBO0433254.1 GIY-YIG nuclease family protein [Enterococcus sp. DIV0849a]MBO0473414.1 GIY-YIG nuclease family protein [Enterococcus ureasiticus]